MTLSIRTPLLLTISLGLATACSGPTAPTKSNYAKVIEAHLENHEYFPHCFFRYNLPIVQQEMQLKMGGLQKELAYLTKVGLLDESIKENTVRGRTTKIYEYTVSEEGADYYIEDRGMCMGEPKFTGIADVSDPYEERGKTYVRGTYTWTIDMPEWSYDPEFYDSGIFGADVYYFKMKKIVAGEDREEYFVLTLNDDGWEL